MLPVARSSTRSPVARLMRRTAFTVVAGMIVVSRVALLFAVCGSVVVALTVAVLLSGWVAVARTITFAMTIAPGAMSPRAHITVAVPVHVPWLADALTSATPAGSWSWTRTSVAAAGPLFVTTSA